MEQKHKNIIYMYMPTMDCDDKMVEKINEKIKETMRYIKEETNLIESGDLKAIVKDIKVETLCTFGKRNEEGNSLIEFCAKHNLGAKNTLFEYYVCRQYMDLSSFLLLHPR